VLVISAFVLRVASPIFPSAFSQPFGGSPATAWGLGYPYNPSPPPDGCVDDVVVSSPGADSRIG
jgi:hypothetical protein